MWLQRRSSTLWISSWTHSPPCQNLSPLWYDVQCCYLNRVIVIKLHLQIHLCKFLSYFICLLPPRTVKGVTVPGSLCFRRRTVLKSCCLSTVTGDAYNWTWASKEKKMRICTAPHYTVSLHAKVTTVFFSWLVPSHKHNPLGWQGQWTPLVSPQSGTSLPWTKQLSCTKQSKKKPVHPLEQIGSKRQLFYFRSRTWIGELEV